MKRRKSIRSLQLLSFIAACFLLLLLPTTTTSASGSPSTSNLEIKKPYVTIIRSVNSVVVGSTFTFRGQSTGIKKAIFLWYSSDHTIAEISETQGLLIARRTGTVTITLKEKNTGKKKQMAVTVTAPLDKEGILTAAELRRNEIRCSITDIVMTGTIYYISNKGDDKHDGKSKKKAWASLSKVNSTKLKPGDTVLFERGGLWRGQLFAKRGVTYSAYGKGEKPKFYGSPENAAVPDKWSLLEGTDNIWVYYKEMTDIGTLVFNEGESWAFKDVPHFINGQFVLPSDHGKEYNVAEQLERNLEFFSAADSYLTKGVPYIPGMENVSDVKGPLYLRCDTGNPGEVFDSIEMLVRGHIITPAKDTLFDNLCVKYGGSHGMFGWGMKFEVQNCEFGWIGGTIQFYEKDTGKAIRFGNAIEASGSFDRFTVTNCYVYQVYDAGLTNQDTDHSDLYRSLSENISYKNNLVEYCTYGIEIFIDTPAPNINDHLYRDLLVEDNLFLYTGFGWGSQRPDENTPCIIQLWDSPNAIEGFIIRRNILYLSSYNLMRCGTYTVWMPQLEGNIFVQNPEGLLAKWRLESDAKSKHYSFSEDNLAEIINNILGDKSASILFLN